MKSFFILFVYGDNSVFTSQPRNIFHLNSSGRKPESFFINDIFYLQGEKKSAAFGLFLGICNRLSVNDGVSGVRSTERLEPGVVRTDGVLFFRAPLGVRVGVLSPPDLCPGEGV